jgi:hypothetical protein
MRSEPILYGPKLGLWPAMFTTRALSRTMVLALVRYDLLTLGGDFFGIKLAL